MQQQTIEETALQTYQENILYLQEKHYDVFEKITALESAIEHGHYQERYELQYKEDGYFDVRERDNEKWLYGKSSIEHAKLAAQSIDYTKEGNLFETFYDVVIEDEDAASYDDAPITHTPYSASARIINYHNKYAQKQQTTMKKIYKFIFFGTGLGLHISEIHKKIKSHVYFITEDDLELFRLSLFVTNYKALTDEGAILYLSIFDDQEEFEEKSNNFLKEMFIYNHYLKFFHILSSNNTRIKDFQKVILSLGYLVFNYAALTSGILRPLEHIKNHYKILNVSKPFNSSFVSTKPFLVLGAGPSFQQNITWIKENQHKFIIVAVSALLSALEEHDIKPHIITHVHGFDDALPHVQKVKDITFFDTTIEMFSTFTTASFLSYFQKENIYLFQGTSEFKKGFSAFSASNIGALTYGLLLRLGVDKLYLLGLDFAIDEKTGATHTASHEYTKQLNIKKTSYDVEDDISYNNSVILTKGNFKEKVKTSLMLDSFKKQADLMTKLYKRKSTKIYNLSDGAHLQETTALQPSEVKIDELMDFTKTYHTLKEIYEKNSENRLTKEDIEALKAKLIYIKKLKTILQEYSQRKYSTMDIFHYNLLGLFQDILAEDFDEDARELNDVISMYLQYISGFIFDIINTKELKNEKHHIKALNKIIIFEINKLITHYEDFLEDFLKEI